MWTTEKKRGVPKGGLDMSCSLAFALVLPVLEKALFCPLPPEITW